VTPVTLIRRIRARPAIVFDAFATAEGLTSWWGPQALPVLSAKADVRVGGDFRVRFPTADGRIHECAGQFLEVRRPELIAMTWSWIAGGEPEEQGRTSRLELRLRPTDEGTELTLVHAELRSELSVQSHTWGWEGALEKLGRLYPA
jgi:uncharacterized protein YndB with AHSA1/START domain